MNIMPKSRVPKIEEFVSSMALVLMAVITAVQVFNRYVLGNSLDWSEELARYLFIWSVYVGCSYASQMNRHLEVTIIRTIFKGRLARLATITASICTIVFCVFCTIVGIKFVIFLANTGQKTPALEIQAYWLFICLPVGMGFMALRTMEHLWWLVTNKTDPAHMNLS